MDPRNRQKRMDSTVSGREEFRIPPWVILSLIVFIGIVSFGLLIPYLGYFWDDFPLAWIAEIYGKDGLVRYFSTNRPYWGLLYQITTPLLGSVPWHWQLFGLVWRILTAVAFWLLLRKLWPNKPMVALFGSIAFLVYPGFTQQWISLVYSHFFIILTAFITSLMLTILSVRKINESEKSAAGYIYAFLALLLSLINLISMEYFFTLELIRPFLIWIINGEYFYDRKVRIQKTILNWSPYLLLFAGVIVWRAFFFPYQTVNYQLGFFDRFSEGPFSALFSLFLNIITSVWKVGILSWLSVFFPPNLSEVGRITIVVSYGLALISFGLIFLWLFIFIRRSMKAVNSNDSDAGFRIQLLWLSLIALLLAGWPFWLIDLAPDLKFSLDRFTLPFMLGSALLIISIIEFLHINFMLKSIIILILICFSIGRNFRLANDYRRDWELQRRFFWQLVWRVPNLKKGTTILTNELPLTYYSDNSLTAPLNWIYAPDNSSEKMSYFLLYAARRLGSSLPKMKENQPIEVDYLAANFHGNTSQIVTVFYEPPACLRVLDENLDVVNHMLPLLMQEAATLSSYENILLDSDLPPAVPPEEIYAPEENHGWCYYYQKAEIARQAGDWEQVIKLGEQAFALGDYPNDPAERLPYIEGYARTGNWERAVQLTEESGRVSPDMNPVLCLVWERIDNGTHESNQKDEALTEIGSMLDCSK